MKRELNFTGHGKLAESLGISAARVRELDGFIGTMIEQHASLEDVIAVLNLRGDLTDAEWTYAMFTLGRHWKEERDDRD